jgi:exodeoxyribonuclease VII large subunit
VCILRGGGSRTDLAWFDDMDIALAVARLPLKALIGIGHERDRSVLDEIAHSEKTPTAVAAFLVDTVLGLRRKVAERAVQLQRSVGRLLQREAQWLARSTVSLESGGNARLRGERQRLATATRDLARGSLLALANGKSALATAADKLRTSALKSCERERQALLRASDRGRHAAQRVVERAGDRLERLSLRLRLLDPRKVVARGYALVRDDKGRVLPSASRVEAGQNLVLQMRDGAVRVRAESIEPQS